MIHPTRPSFIYFLIDNDQVVYIGQTCRLGERLRENRHQEKRKFTHYRAIICDDLTKDFYERRWIIRFKPKYNSQFNPFPSSHGTSVKNRLIKVNIYHIRDLVRRDFKRRNILWDLEDTYDLMIQTLKSTL